MRNSICLLVLGFAKLPPSYYSKDTNKFFNPLRKWSYWEYLLTGNHSLKPGQVCHVSQELEATVFMGIHLNKSQLDILFNNYDIFIMQKNPNPSWRAVICFRKRSSPNSSCQAQEEENDFHQETKFWSKKPRWDFSMLKLLYPITLTKRAKQGYKNQALWTHVSFFLSLS